MTTKHQLIAEIESARRTVKSATSMGRLTGGMDRVAETQQSLAEQLQIKIRNLDAMSSSDNASVLEELADETKQSPYTPNGLSDVWTLLTDIQKSALTAPKSKRARRSSTTASSVLALTATDGGSSDSQGQHLTKNIIYYLVSCLLFYHLVHTINVMSFM